MTVYSPNLDIPHLDANTDEPEVVVNTAIDAFDAKITDAVVVPFGGNTVTLTQDEQSAGSIFHLTTGSPGPTGAITLNFAAFGMGNFSVINGTARTATLQISGQSLTPPTLSAGQTAGFSCDGTNVRATGATSGVDASAVSYESAVSPSLAYPTVAQALDALYILVSGAGTGNVNGPGSSTNSDFAMFSGTSGKVLKDNGLSLTTDGTLTSNSDSLIPSEKAVKTYVDAVAQGLSIRDSCLLATNAALPTNTYLSGVITITATGTLTVDGVVTALGDRILVKNESSGANNGIYTVTTAGALGVQAVLTRASDFNTSSNIIPGAFTFIESGTANQASGWVLTTTGSIVVGVTVLTFTQFSGAGSSGYVTGPGSSTDGHVALFNGGTGKVIKDTGLTLSGTNTGDQNASGVNYTSAISPGPNATNVAAALDEIYGIALHAGSGQTASITIILDGGGAVIPTGIQRDLVVPYACTVNSCTMLADQGGAIVVGLWKCTYAQFDNGSTHPVIGDSMTASAPPTISATNYKSQDNTVTGWGAISAGDVIRPNVNSVTTIQKLTLVLKVTKT